MTVSIDTPRRGETRYVEGKTPAYVQSVNLDDELAECLIETRRGKFWGLRLITYPFVLLEKEPRK